MISAQPLRKQRAERAQAIVAVFVYVSAVSILAIALVSQGMSLRKLVHRDYTNTRAMYAAEAGIARWMAQRVGGAAAGTGTYTTAESDSLGTITTITVTIGEAGGIITADATGWM